MIQDNIVVKKMPVELRLRGRPVFFPPCFLVSLLAADNQDGSSILLHGAKRLENNGVVKLRSVIRAGTPRLRLPLGVLYSAKGRIGDNSVNLPRGNE
jgi:hypothetical protein